MRRNETRAFKDGLGAIGAKDLAHMLGVSLRHVRRLESAGRIGPEPVRLGRCVRYLTSQISAWLEAGAPDRATWLAEQGGDR